MTSIVSIGMLVWNYLIDSSVETEDGLCGFDGLSALPLPRLLFESVDDSIKKLNDTFQKTLLRAGKVTDVPSGN